MKKECLLKDMDFSSEERNFFEYYFAEGE